MKPEDWIIYAARLPNQQMTYQSTYTTIPLVVGGHIEGELSDSTGINISKLNPYYCELTGVYWVIHNTDHEFVGNAHYRRKWNEQDVRNSRPDTLYVSDAHRFPFSLARQFKEGHAGFDAATATIQLAKKKKIPLSVEQLEATWNGNVFHGCLTARGLQEHYRQFMNLLFECLDPFWATHKRMIKEQDAYNRRMVGFVGERMMTALILNAAHFFSFPVEQSRLEFWP